MTRYNDTPLKVRVLAVPKGVTVSGKACISDSVECTHRPKDSLLAFTIDPFRKYATIGGIYSPWQSSLL